MSQLVVRDNLDFKGKQYKVLETLDSAELNVLHAVLQATSLEYQELRKEGKVELAKRVKEMYFENLFKINPIFGRGDEKLETYMMTVNTAHGIENYIRDAVGAERVESMKQEFLLRFLREFSQFQIAMKDGSTRTIGEVSLRDFLALARGDKDVDSISAFFDGEDVEKYRGEAQYSLFRSDGGQFIGDVLSSEDFRTIEDYYNENRGAFLNADLIDTNPRINPKSYFGSCSGGLLSSTVYSQNYQPDGEMNIRQFRNPRRDIYGEDLSALAVMFDYNVYVIIGDEFNKYPANRHDATSVLLYQNEDGVYYTLGVHEGDRLRLGFPPGHGAIPSKEVDVELSPGDVFSILGISYSTPPSVFENVSDPTKCIYAVVKGAQSQKPSSSLCERIRARRALNVR